MSMPISIRFEQGGVALVSIKSEPDDIGAVEYSFCWRDFCVGSFTVSDHFYEADVVQFREQIRVLYTSLAGVAALESITGKIRLRVEMRSGRVEVTGVLEDFDRCSRLEFAFLTDQTYLSDSQVSEGFSESQL